MTVSKKLNSARERGHVNIIDLSDKNETPYRKLLIYEDCYSRFIVLKAMQTDTSQETAKCLLDILTIIGVPKVLQTTRGRDFTRQVVEELHTIWPEISLLHGDVVDYENGCGRDFGNIIDSWLNGNPTKSWAYGIKIVQAIENTSFRWAAGKTPFELLFTHTGIVGGGGGGGEDEARDENMPGLNESNLVDVNFLKDCFDNNITIDNSDEADGILNIVKNCNLFSKEDNSINSINGQDIVIPIIRYDESSIRKAVVDADNQYCELQSNLEQSADNLSKADKSAVSDIYSLIPESTLKEYFSTFNDEETLATIDNNKATSNNHGIPDGELKRHGNGKKLIPRDLCPTRVDDNSPSDWETLAAPKYSPSLVSEQTSAAKRKKNKNGHSSCNVKSKPNATTKNSSNLKCQYCNQSFAFASVLTRHLRSHTNERPYTCSTCNKSFKQPGHLSQHLIIHTEYRASRCCGYKFDSLKDLQLHARTCHSNAPGKPAIPKLFECNTCKKVLASKAMLKKHVVTHSQERLYGCEECGKKFKQMGHVKAHMLVHTGEKRFICELCGGRFSLAVSLRKHMYVHGELKPYGCDLCGARFVEKRNLRGHLVTHTNVRPFVCKICGKGYTLEDTLRRHEQLNHLSAGGSHKCEICARMFKRRAHLTVHMKVHT